MGDDIKVHVVEFSDRKFYMMQWRDPLSGRKKSRSTRVERTGRKKERTEAERVAAKFESDLREGRYCRPSQVAWADFRQRYEDEYLPALADATAVKVGGVFNRIESILNPSRLRELDAKRLSYFQAEMRRSGLAEPTIKANLAHLKAALGWAERIGMLPRVPKIEMPKRAKKAGLMKGRPITREEFERMLVKVPAVVGEKIAPSWQYYLEGLWASGLRLTESLDLFWDRDDKLCVDLSGKHPMLRIPGELEKGNRDRLLPMSPEFCEFLLATPAAERTGPVFNPAARRKGNDRVGPDRACRVICDIGEAARVKVHSDPKTGRVKFASAHDLRRSFGERWSARIMPADLLVLLRHETFETTMRFYIGRNAQNTAAKLWAAHEKAGGGNTLGNSGVSARPAAVKAGGSTPYGPSSCEIGPEGFEPPTKGL